MNHKLRAVTHPTAWILMSCLLSLTTSVRGSQGDDKDSVRTPETGLFPLPIIFYTPETGFAGGFAVLYLYRAPDASVTNRPTSAAGNIIYTAKKQIVVSVSGDMYFEDNKYRLLTDVTFQKYPNKFYGIGNFTSADLEESYTPQAFSVRVAGYTHVYSRFNAGPLVRYESVSMQGTEPLGMLRAGTIAGSRGGTAAGLGFAMNWDSRDNTFATSSGSLQQVTALFYRGMFGSDYSYTDIQIDSRNFFEVVPGQVLALQAAAELTDGAAPFQSLAKFGGQNILRGYFEGRYRDRQGVAFQVEYRVPLWWRFGLVGFAGVAQVSPIINEFALNRFWFAGGLGMRFLLNPDDRINLRLDLGYGNNSSGVYVTVTEAF